MSRARTVVAAAAVALLTLGACADEAGDHNDADVSFAQEMIPHHAQAVTMSSMLLDADEVHPEVVDLAEQIKQAQAPEIDTMTGWLREWDEDVPDTDGMDEMAGMSGDGMMSAGEMRALDEADGDAASRMFLNGMTVHHEGAIEMAEREIEAGESPQAVELATTIVETQQAEIDRMRELLDSL